MATLATIAVLLFTPALIQITESHWNKNEMYLQSLLDGGTKRSVQKIEKTHVTLDTLEATIKDIYSKMDAINSKMSEMASVCQGAKVFLRRQDGSVDFSRRWKDYRDGFGDPEGEFWLGLASLHRLTSHRNYRLRVDLLDWSGERKWAEYEHFSVGPESEKFKLNISGYDPFSTAGDSMMVTNSTYTLNGMKFSTIDAEHDLSGYNCATIVTGCWWNRACSLANPTGEYKPEGSVGWKVMTWTTAYNERRSLKAITLKIVPAA